VSVALDYLLDDLEHAPTGWILSTLEHMSMIRRADVIMHGDEWELVAVQAEAARVTDQLLLELGRRIHDDDDE